MACRSISPELGCLFGTTASRSTEAFATVSSIELDLDRLRLELTAGHRGRAFYGSAWRDYAQDRE